MKIFSFQKIFFVAVVLWVLLWSAFLAAKAEAVVFGDTMNFYVEKDFDSAARTKLQAVLVKTTQRLYFYIDEQWWNSQVEAKKNEVLARLDLLSSEFNDKIYPTITSVFGSEWRPGVDGDEKITILFEPMNANEGGYFRTTDEYVRLQLPESNEREMIYLSLDYISDPQLKVVLAHELVHLITFNQKNKNFNIEEETWLNEARADYASTILGYNTKYEGSNLQRRVRDFIESSSDSIVEWKGTKYDYASLSLFTHYLLDHYGINILVDSLKSKYIGIESLNYALGKNGVQENFQEIFTNWTIASVLNNCSFNLKYCYLNENLKNFKILPTLNFLPLTGSVSLSVTNVIKNWQPSWLKFIGGNGDIELDFSSLKGLNFSVPYIVGSSDGNYEVNYLLLDENEKGKISISGFGKDYTSLIVIPSLQTKISGFEGSEPTYPYTYSVSIKGDVSTEDQLLMQQLLDKIAYLKSEIARLLAEKAEGGAKINNISCSSINNNLSVGMSNNEIKCLQEFLKNQGVNIYPEGYVTGNFGLLTKSAVIRFQEKYASEILSPIGLQFGTGFVGASTRQKINQLLITK